MEVNKDQTILADHLIDQYRELIKYRYDYDALKNRIDLPDGVTKETVQQIERYFLESLYPDADTRKELDAAFEQLEKYVTDFGKIWGLLGSMTRAVFKFGFQFPAAIKSGNASLRAYTDAKKFEKVLLEAALAEGKTVPLSREEFEMCIRHIPRKQVERFINDVAKLFKAITDTSLVGKTVEILDDVISTMKKKPHIYSEVEVQGIIMGRDILEKGYHLFKPYPPSLKQEMIRVIRENEHWFLEELYEN